MTTSPIKSVPVVNDSRAARMLIRNGILGIHPHGITTKVASIKQVPTFFASRS